MPKTTLSTIKSFIRKNEGRLFIKCKSSFDGMVDCVMPNKDAAFTPAIMGAPHEDASLGIHGAWFVRGSRDWFKDYEDETFKGYDVSNCCGSFTLAVRK